MRGFSDTFELYGWGVLLALGFVFSHLLITSFVSTFTVCNSFQRKSKSSVHFQLRSNQTWPTPLPARQCPNLLITSYLSSNVIMTALAQNDWIMVRLALARNPHKHLFLIISKVCISSHNGEKREIVRVSPPPGYHTSAVDHIKESSPFTTALCFLQAEE